MSYDFSIEIDTGGPERHHIEPYFADEHPAFDGDGMAGNAITTATGYARCGNYTSNVSLMWSKCLTSAVKVWSPAVAWCGSDDRRMRERHPNHDYYGKLEPRISELVLRDLAGLRAGDIAPLLKAAVEWGVEHIDELHEFDPDNGWGDATGAVTYLWDIQRMCEQHPNGYLYISS